MFQNFHPVGIMFLQKCHLHSLSEGNGAITAQQRGSTSENTGFTFLGCKITGVGTPYLGRPWGPYSRVVFVLSFMSSVVQPQGWDDWGDSNKQRYICHIPSQPNYVNIVRINGPTALKNVYIYLFKKVYIYIEKIFFYLI